MYSTPVHTVYLHDTYSMCIHIDGSAQDCNNLSALAIELLQSYTEASIYTIWIIE